MSEVWAVEAEGVRKRFGQVEALVGLDFRLGRGQIVAILGPNGAGKTTLLSLLLGLRRPTAGRIAVFGEPPGSLAARARIGAMLQETSVIEELRVKETIDLFRSFYADPRPTAELLELAGLTREANRMAAGLSGGQKRRLAFALALAGRPDLLFLDEPTVGFDVESRRRFWDVVRGLARETTVVLSTHYLEEADALAHRVIVLFRGRIVADAPPEAIKAGFGGRWIRFDFDGEAPPFDPARLPGAKRVELGRGRARVLTVRSDEALRELVRHPVREIEVRGADLEEAFLAITSGEAEDGAQGGRGEGPALAAALGAKEDAT
ncbi:MAG: ABC transporter ATP-binding protein [Clostridia bacterium]|nr:ABC transporter ATP-binding protein [Clostridia bacterium]